MAVEPAAVATLDRVPRSSPGRIIEHLGGKIPHLVKTKFLALIEVGRAGVAGINMTAPSEVSISIRMADPSHGARRKLTSND